MIGLIGILVILGSVSQNLREPPRPHGPVFPAVLCNRFFPAAPSRMAQARQLTGSDWML